MAKTIAAALLGAFLGLIGARYLFVGSWLSLIPWTVAGIALGAWSRRREWTVVGVAYGFSLTLIFMVAGYTGARPLYRVLRGFMALGAFGALCGVGLCAVGYWVRQRVARPT